ncbi:MAG: TonB-dependent receptor, partial [Bacteroidales bacterium]|nr:TonB-dependent receptor [Bacteroidales bacterium]
AYRNINTKNLFMIKRKKIYLLLLLTFISVLPSIAQHTIKGTISDKITGERLPNANILIKGTKTGTTSDIKGRFEFKDIKQQELSLIISYIGYETISLQINVKDKIFTSVNVKLIEAKNISKAVVITATKTARKIEDVPARINLLSTKTINSLPSLTSDELLKYTPGITINRAGGFLSHSSNVTMRGMSGADQSRTLILVNGIPVNKSDGGSVNWNLINTANIKRIEVSKGPGSSLYGSNAMGGVVNIITTKPYEKLSIDARIGYGSLNTTNTSININGRLSDTPEKGLYWALNTFYNKSDGYINLIEEERDSTTIKSDMEESAAGALLGYDLNKDNNIELKLDYFDDNRGSGTKILIPDGESMDHDSYKAHLKYSGQIKDYKIKTTLFYQNEDYKKLRENLKYGDYSCYSVNSEREDMGILFHISKNIGEHNIITAGFDLKQGSVDAIDDYTETNKYITANVSDKVYNKGKMNTTALFVQEEISLLKDKLRIVAGLRFDYAKFFDGAYYIENPTSITSILSELENRNINEDTWNSISPRLSAQYKFNENFRTYMSYAKGFRPSVLDDLCRSGFIRGGFKKANPKIKPETIHTFEIGSDILALSNKISISPSIYYSIGKDFQYYVSTGDSIVMGTRIKPILQNENISEVELYGGEIAINYAIMEQLSILANYSYSHSTITNYIANEGENDISGNFLRYVPENQYNIGFNWENKFFNTSILYHYKGEQYADDSNETLLDPFNTIDIMLQRNINKNISLALYVNNVLDEVTVVDVDYLSMGRFVKAELRLNF